MTPVIESHKLSKWFGEVVAVNVIPRPHEDLYSLGKFLAKAAPVAR